MAATVLRQRNQKRLSTRLGSALTDDADVTGQTLTPASYVGYDPAGSLTMGVVQVGKAQVRQSQELILVSFFSRPWPILQRAVDGSPLIAHDENEAVESFVSPLSLGRLVGWYQAGVLVGNTIEVDIRGATLSLDGERVVVQVGGGGIASPASAQPGGFPLAGDRPPIPSRIRAAAASFNAATFT